MRGGAGWWQPAVNLLGCIFFGISAAAGYVVPSTGSMLDQAAANWNTSLGAACFLACALDTLHTDRVSKMPLGRRPELEHRWSPTSGSDRRPAPDLRDGRRSLVSGCKARALRSRRCSLLPELEPRLVRKHPKEKRVTEPRERQAASLDAL